MSMDMDTLRQLCVEYRKSHGITQKEVARDIGCSVENVSAFESGRNSSSRVLLWYIHKGLFISEVK